MGLSEEERLDLVRERFEFQLCLKIWKTIFLGWCGGWCLADEDESVTLGWCLRMIRCLVSGSMVKNIRGGVLLLVVEEKWKLGDKEVIDFEEEKWVFFSFVSFKRGFLCVFILFFFILCMMRGAY